MRALDQAFREVAAAIAALVEARGRLLESDPPVEAVLTYLELASRHVRRASELCRALKAPRQ